MSSNSPGRADQFTWLPDLASRRFGGSVVFATDEFFGAKENLVRAERPAFSPHTFGPKGQVYDGWETRRHAPGHDYAIVRLGMPGIVRGVVVDTAYFTGNYPPEVSVEGLDVDATADVSGPASTDPDGVAPERGAGMSGRGVFSGRVAASAVLAASELVARTDWFPLVARSPVTGDTRTAFAVDLDRRITHVRLSIYPDGGVARLRVHGEAVPGPLALALGVGDLAALENGALVVDASDAFYGSAQNLLAPGLARTMGEGWETRRRRDAGHDWVVVRLAARGTVRLVEVDTTAFIGNAPESAALSTAEVPARGRDQELTVGRPAVPGAGGLASRRQEPSSSEPSYLPTAAEWVPLLDRTALVPDTRHQFLINDARPATHVRLDIFPDGGLSRLRLWGSPTG